MNTIGLDISWLPLSSRTVSWATWQDGAIYAERAGSYWLASLPHLIEPVPAGSGWTGGRQETGAGEYLPHVSRIEAKQIKLIICILG